MTAEEPLNLRCSATGSATAVILAVIKMFLIINKCNKVRIIFKKY